MVHGKWVYNPRAQSVELTSNDGLVSDDSMLIWRAQFEGLQGIGGVIHTSPGTDLPQITFHAELGQLLLQIRRTAKKQHVLVPAVRGAYATLPLPDLPTVAQAVAGGHWFALSSDQCDRVRSTLAERGIRPHVELSEEQVLWLYWKSGLEVEFSADPTADVPAREATYTDTSERLTARLYPYQVQGVARLKALYSQQLGCLLADEMGLGKTLQVIALLASVCTHGPSVVVGPASTLANWAREFSRFAPTLKVLVHQGPLRTGRPANLSAQDVVVVSYETLVQDALLFAQIDWNVIALDEAQGIKNPSAKRSATVKQLKAISCIAVTGTPIENSLRDLWSIMEFVAAKYLPPFKQFQESYPDETWAAAQLGTLIAPLVIRRNVKEVASDLPPRVDSFVPLAMGAELAQRYNAIRQSDVPVLAKLTAMRLCAASADMSHQGSKMTRLAEIADEAFASQKKVLVFSSFTTSIDEIASYFQGRPGVFAATIDGRTSVDRRQNIIDEYSAHQGPGILILNPRAAGVGLNIQAANYVVHFTPEWNPAVVDQASARAHRRGQLQPVVIYYLFYEESVESVMVDRLNFKRELQRSGMDTTKDGPDKTELERILSLTPKENL